MLEWDENKSRKNKKVRGFDFSIVHEFDFASAINIEDQRKDYGEPRYRSIGQIDGKWYFVCWTLRERNIRVISVRRAHRKEVMKYDHEGIPRPLPD